MVGDGSNSALDVDSLVASTLHYLESASPPATTASLVAASSPSPVSSAAPASSAALPPSSSRPHSSSRSAAVESLNGRQLRVECLQRLLPALQSAGLLSSYQRSILHSALSSYSPRYLQVADAWLQAERAHQLAVRAAVRNTNSSAPADAATASSAHSALPAPPTSLCQPSNSGEERGSGTGLSGAGPSHPSSLPLSSLLSSGVASSGFSPSLVLAHLLSAALISSLEEAWLACFMSIPTRQAKRLSKAERVRLDLSGSSELVYGEVTFASLARLVWSLPELSPGGRFVDLGSGAGRGVIGALLLHDWEEVRGIELLDGLHRASEQVKDKVERDRKAGGLGGVAVLQHHVSQSQSQSQPQPQMQPQSDESGSGGVAQQRSRHCRITLTKANFFDVDWSDADVVLANSVCFSEDSMQRLAQQATLLRPGAYCNSTQQHTRTTQAGKQASRHVQTRRYEAVGSHCRRSNARY